jgi:hypothetical protein
VRLTNPRRRRRTIAALATLAASAALVLGVPGGAQASDVTNSDNVSISTYSSSYADGTLVTVSASGLAASTSYTVGICEYYTYTTFGSAQIPACMLSSQVTATTNSSGVLTLTNYRMRTYGANAHAALQPGQPLAVDCDANLCEIVVSPTHGGGTGGSYRGDSLEFYVS